jgi:hypothetical protein
MAELGGRESHGGEQQFHPRRHAGRFPFLEARHQSDVGLDRPVREQSRVLNDVAHAAAHPHRVPLDGRAAFEADLTGGYRRQSVDGFEQGGFARAATA